MMAEGHGRRIEVRLSRHAEHLLSLPCHVQVALLSVMGWCKRVAIVRNRIGTVAEGISAIAQFVQRPLTLQDECGACLDGFLQAQVAATSERAG